MEIQKLRLYELTPASYNPRKKLTPDDVEYKKIRRSLEEFGCVEPVIFNRTTGTLVSGHQRVRILQDLGETEIEAVIVDIDSITEEKKLNVLLNKVKGEWDDDKLAEVLQELEKYGDIEITGFDEWELQGILDSYNQLGTILDLSDDEYDGEAEAEEPIETIEMEFEIPAEYKEIVENYLDTVDSAEEELAEVVLELIGVV